MMRRGISEILSAVIIIAVVVSGLGLYVGLSQQRILGDTASVIDVITLSKEQNQEILESIAMFRNDTQSNVIEVYVFNSGLKNMTISNVFVNGTINMNNTAYVKDLDENRIWPNDKVIPMGNTTKIILNFTDSPSLIPITEGIKNLVIVTTSNKFIEIVNDTSN